MKKSLLKKCRIELGMSLQELSDISGVCPASICIYEKKGEITNINKMIRLAKCLGRDVCDFCKVKRGDA